MRCPVCHRRLLPDAACPLHDTRAPHLPGEELSPPPPVPGFTTTSLLGRGGFAWVLAALRESDDRPVALKLARTPGDPRFALEAEALRRVGPPTVPALLAEGEAGGHPYLALELLEGTPLSSWLASLPGAGQAPLPEALRLFCALCEAAHRLHRVGLTHRDIKPENIFLRRDGSVALLDLGLAAFAGPEAGTSPRPDLTRPGQRLGTVHYMAPELCAGEGRGDARSDVYSLGAVLFELLTGRPPFVGEATDVLHAHAALRPTPPSELAAAAAPLDAFVLRSLAKEPARRLSDAGAALEALPLELGQVPPAPATALALTALSSPPAAVSDPTRPVALLGLVSQSPVTELAAAMELEGGTIARIQRERYVVAFPDHRSPAAGLKAALRAAWRWGRDRRIIHVAELRARPGRSSTRLAGAALGEAPGWWEQAPAGEHTWVTPEAAALLEDGAGAPGQGGYLALDGEATTPDRDETFASPPLVGREELLESLERGAREALRRLEPTLLVLEGDAGLGKTRLLEALAELLARGGEVRVALVRARAQEELLRLGAELTPEQSLAEVGAMPAEARRHALARRIGEGLRHAARERPLVVLLDDAHRADAISLDALELAALAEARAAVWICAAARPELLELRPGLGERAGSVRVLPLPPLPPSAARRLLLELLHPVEYVPEAALERLEALAQGVPLYLVELARALRQAGALRRDPVSGAWSLAPDELLDVSPASLLPRLGERALSALPAAARALAQLGAVLGQEVTPEAVAAAQAHLEPDVELASLAALDAGVGLARLVRGGVLQERAGGVLAIHPPLLREALEASLPPRLRRLFHRAALRSLPDEPGEEEVATLRRRARHAAESGEPAVAAEAYLRLAEHDRLAHRVLEAEQAYTTALELLPAGEHERRRQALAGRGKVRARSYRYRQAREDLGQAAALALARGDRIAAAELFLEEATVLDWMEDWDGSAEMTRRALELDAVGEGEHGALALRLSLARGRLAVRSGKWDEAARWLAQTAEAARHAKETEVRAIALVLLGTALVLTDRLEEAEATFEAALAHCRATGDSLHLAIAYNNRGLLWQKRQSMDRAMDDLRLNLALSRELGHPQIERWTTFNLAEFLHYLGREEEARPLARRAHELGQRFFQEPPVATDALLLARLAVARGDVAEARQQLAWVDARCGEALSPAGAVQRRMVRQAVAELSGDPFSPDAWDALVADGRSACTPDELLELLLLAASRAAGDEARSSRLRYLNDAGPLAERSPMWRPRLDALRDR